MMFTCTTSGCTDLAHAHGFSAVRKGSAAAARARKRSVSTRLVRDKKGRSLRVDIHCHYLNRDAAAKLAHLNPARSRAKSTSSRCRSAPPSSPRSK